MNLEKFERVLELTDPVMEGKDVEKLQRFLVQTGYGTVFLQGRIRNLTVDGKFGPVTEEALQSFEAKIDDYAVHKAGIPDEYRTGGYWEFLVDGKLTPSTHWIINNFQLLQEYYKVDFDITQYQEQVNNQIKEAKTLGEKIRLRTIEIAMSQIGVKEKAPYRNSGKQVELYQCVGSCDSACYSGWAWCAAFCNWCEIQACKEFGVAHKGPCAIYTPSQVQWGVDRNLAKKYPGKDFIEPGMRGFVHSASRGGSIITSVQHIYFITGFKGSNYVVTVEGNTNPGGGSEGFGVFGRQRSIASVKAAFGSYKVY